MTMRRHPVRQHPRRTVSGTRTMVVNHARGTGATSRLEHAAINAALPDLATRYIGNCQTCAADHKLDTQRLVVHHGYRRPGDGSIHGDCMGVGEPPYEVSCDACKRYLGHLLAHADTIRDGIAHYENPDLSSFTRTRPSYQRHKPPVTTTYTKGVNPAYEWKSELENVLRGLQGELDGVTSEIRRIERRIAAWAPKPLRTVEEEIRRETTETEARRNAKAAERATKAAALADKRAVLLASRAGSHEKTVALARKFRSDALAIHETWKKIRANGDPYKQQPDVDQAIAKLRARLYVKSFDDRMHGSQALKPTDKYGPDRYWGLRDVLEKNDGTASIERFDSVMEDLGLAKRQQGAVGGPNRVLYQ